MGCGCGCGSSGSCSCSGQPRFTRLTPQQFQNTLAQKLISTADRIRDLFTLFGLRPYQVRIIRTRWTGAIRGAGQEYVTAELFIEPTPLISDLTGVMTIVSPVGLDEVGDIVLSEVSGRFTDNNLRGIDVDGSKPEPNEQVYYEVVFPLQPGTTGGERRRFFINSAPMYQADNFQWRVKLDRSHQNRARNGDPMAVH